MDFRIHVDRLEGILLPTTKIVPKLSSYWDGSGQAPKWYQLGFEPWPCDFVNPPIWFNVTSIDAGLLGTFISRGIAVAHGVNGRDLVGHGDDRPMDGTTW